MDKVKRFLPFGDKFHMRKKDVLTTGQVAEVCNVAPRTVTKWFDSGQLKGYRIPGSKDRRIPLHELMQFMKAHEIPMDKIQKGKLRILMIDSRVDHCRSMTSSLQVKGSYEIKSANNVFEAGLLALKFSPNVILIDLMNNQIDAQQVCSYVRKTEELQDCSLIALAGGLSEKDATNLRALGFNDIVIDSSNLMMIVAAIDNACSIIS